MTLLRPPPLAFAFAALLGLCACKGDMIRDAGGGQGDGGSPGREVDDGGLDGRTPTDGDLEDGDVATGPGDGAATDAGCGDTDGSADADCPDGGTDAG